MPISKLEKFEKLAALTTSPNLHEALAAARLALELCRPGGPLQVVEREPRPGEPGWEQTGAGRFAIAYATEMVARKRSEEPARSGKIGARVLQAARASGWVFFAAAQWGGRCRANCGARVESGEPVFWKRGEGILCVACAAEQAEEGELP